MTALYSITRTCRQGLHQHIARQTSLEIQELSVIIQADLIRQRHPEMGSRQMYKLMPSVELGRDRCERVLMASGFRIVRRAKYVRTTNSQPFSQFKDQITGKTLSGINQVWQSDITYYLSKDGKVFYIVFIEDVYSRRILGWCAHDHMRAEANIVCLQLAIKTRNCVSLKGLIHHSDRGTQYGSNGYLFLLEQQGIKVSMSKEAWQNAYVERVNGTIKNSYLYSWELETLTDLRKALTIAVNAYNMEKPHQNLPMQMSPITFEKSLQNNKSNLKVKIYDHRKIKMLKYG
jgi:putative transposase